MPPGAVPTICYRDRLHSSIAAKARHHVSAALSNTRRQHYGRLCKGGYQIKVAEAIQLSRSPNILTSYEGIQRLERNSFESIFTFVLYTPLSGGFPKLGVPFWGFLIIRIMVFWGLYWGPPIEGNYYLGKHVARMDKWRNSAVADSHCTA